MHADKQSTVPPDLARRREAFYDRLAARSIRPLWTEFRHLVPRMPHRRLDPALWHYDELRAAIMEAGELITAKEAERRALILENPARPGEARITATLYAAVQLVLPGDVAPAHRHTQSALRFVLEGEGAFTAVDGERTRMSRGDLVLTPTWTWHDHGNETDQPMIWLDGLDIPLIADLDLGFAEHWPEDRQPIARPEEDSPMRYGEGLLPDGYRAAPAGASPVFNYRYARCRRALLAAAANGPLDPWTGCKMRYAHPGTGGWPMATIGPCLQFLPAGFATRPLRATDGRVFVAVEGRGSCVLEDGTRLDFGPNDIFVVPNWTVHRLHADADLVLFSYSDRPVQEALGLWREERLGEEA